MTWIIQSYLLESVAACRSCIKPDMHIFYYFAPLLFCFFIIWDCRRRSWWMCSESVNLGAKINAQQHTLADLVFCESEPERVSVFVSCREPGQRDHWDVRFTFPKTPGTFWMYTLERVCLSWSVFWAALVVVRVFFTCARVQWCVCSACRDLERHWDGMFGGISGLWRMWPQSIVIKHLWFIPSRKLWDPCPFVLSYLNVWYNNFLCVCVKRQRMWNVIGNILNAHLNVGLVGSGTCDVNMKLWFFFLVFCRSRKRTDRARCPAIQIKTQTIPKLVSVLL